MRQTTYQQVQDFLNQVRLFNTVESVRHIAFMAFFFLKISPSNLFQEFGYFAEILPYSYASSDIEMHDAFCNPVTEPSRTSRTSPDQPLKTVYLD